MDLFVIRLSYWLALIISIGSLFFYIRLALKSRRHMKDTEDENYDFHLGLTIESSRNKNKVFAYALVAAGTSLSTVFVFFLTSSSIYGWLIYLSPIMFAIGNYIMFLVYKKAEENGYFNENNYSRAGLTGLIPYLGQVITGSKNVGYVLMILSFINLLAVLVLELFIGAEIISYLFNNTLGTPLSTPESFSIVDFVIFVLSITLLLGYVFIGGFRAVVSSDYWQMKAMKTTIVIVFLSSLILFLLRKQSFDFTLIDIKVTDVSLYGFILNVILANIFAPLSQESSWQRFRAFRAKNFNFTEAMKKSIINSLLLWIGLIFISFLIIVLSNNSSLSDIVSVLGAVQKIDTVWFPLLVFPLIASACLFAMYSTADTCVSALIYLIDYVYSSRSDNGYVKRKLQSYHKIGMAFIFTISIFVYLFIHEFFNPTILQLVFSVFSNLVVIAPTILLTQFLKYNEFQSKKNIITSLVLVSLILGSLAYWSSSIYSLIKGAEYLWLSQLAILSGLVFALLPILPIYFRKVK